MVWGLVGLLNVDDKSEIETANHALIGICPIFLVCGALDVPEIDHTGKFWQSGRGSVLFGSLATLSSNCNEITWT